MSAPDFDDSSALKYRYAQFADPLTAEAILKGVDPNNPIKAVHAEIRDDKIRPFFKRYILQDLTSMKRISQIHPNIMDLYRRLQKANLYRKLSVNFEPGQEEDTLKVILDLEKKRRISGSIDTQLAKDGSAVLEGKLVVRNVFGMLDYVTVEATQGWGGNVLESFLLKYSLPIFYKDYSLDLTFEKSFRDLIPTVREESSGRTITVFNDSTYFKFSDILKLNFVDLLNHSKETLNREIFPLRRHSIKVGKIWNTVYEIEKEYGHRTELSGELGTGTGGSPFAKVEFNNHTFFNPSSFDYKKKLKLINFENYISVGATVPLSRSRLRMNDRFYSYNLRGFSEIANVDSVYDKTLHPLAGSLGLERLGDYGGDDVFIKEAFKVNFNRFPYLRQAGLVPFLYYATAYLSGNIMNKRLEDKPVNLFEEIKQNTRHSFGVGIAKPFGPIKLEILLNMFAKGKETDRFARFQLRIASTD